MFRATLCTTFAYIKHKHASFVGYLNVKRIMYIVYTIYAKISLINYIH